MRPVAVLRGRASAPPALAPAANPTAVSMFESAWPIVACGPVLARHDRLNLTDADNLDSGASS